MGWPLESLPHVALGGGDFRFLDINEGRLFHFLFLASLNFSRLVLCSVAVVVIDFSGTVVFTSHVFSS